MKKSKNRLINLLKLGVLFISVSIVLWNCQKENFEDVPLSITETTKSPFTQRKVKLSDIPKVKNKLPTKYNNDIQKRNNDNNEPIFDVNNVLEVIDTLNNSNYSISFILPNAPETNFYNLIVSRNSEGELQTPFVLKYVCDQENLEEFTSNNNDFSYFKGTVSLHKYTDYFEVDYFDSRGGSTACPPNLDANGDPIECDIIQIDGSNAGGGNSNTGGNDGGWSPSGISYSSSSCTFTHHTVYPCWCEGNLVGPHSHAASYSILIIYCNQMQRSAKGENDCPDCSTSSAGATGVSTVTYQTIKSTLKNALSLNSAQLSWILDDENIMNSAQIYNYIEGYNFDGVYPNYVINFAELALNAEMNDGVVNYNEYYIQSDIPDVSFDFQGTTQLIPNPITLSNGDQVAITFGTTTSDNLNANQQVSSDLIDGIRFALEQANNNLSSNNKITSIYIMATTNGHSNSSSPNHPNGTAVDISRINGQKMAISGITNQITELQNAFDNFTYIRENFGPVFNHKTFTNGTQNLNYPVGDHSSHIHISIRRF